MLWSLHQVSVNDETVGATGRIQVEVIFPNCPSYAVLFKRTAGCAD